MRSARLRTSTLVTVLFCLPLTAGCGYSQEEWDQKTREGEGTRAALEQAKRAEEKCERDSADIAHELDSVKKRLLAQGVDLDRLESSAAEQKRAVDEYSARKRQLDELSAQFTALGARLAELGEPEVRLELRDNRVAVVLPEARLFEPTGTTLRAEGRSLLVRVVGVIGHEPKLLQRPLEVRVHAGLAASAPRGNQDPSLLSVARSRSVVLALLEPAERGGVGLTAARVSAAGYFQPGSSKLLPTGEAQARNGWIELVLGPLPEEALDLSSLRL